MSTLGTKLKELRKSKNLTQDELANELNIRFELNLNKGMISKWESDKSEPTFKYTKYIAEYYGIRVDYLLGISDYKTIYEEWDATIDGNELANEVKLLKSIEKTFGAQSVELLGEFSKLNLKGKKEANKRVSELTEISKYTYVEEQHIGMAAHNDFADDKEQQQLMQEDLDEL